jgi:hypothetical protein
VTLLLIAIAELGRAWGAYTEARIAANRMCPCDRCNS